MENQSEDKSPPTAADVGNAFIHHYYALFQESETLYKFYIDSSVLSRPGPDGKTVSVTTIQDINKMILSLNYKNYAVEILNADSQDSLNGGVIVLVTGYLTGNNMQRKFTQSFFLAPQERGYFVLNDIFNYVDDVTIDENTSEASLPPNHVVTEPSGVADMLSQTPSAEANNTDIKEVNNTDIKQVNNTDIKEVKNTHAKEADDVLENGQETIMENSGGVDNPVESRQTVTPQVMEAAPSNNEQDAPKKSYASVVNALSRNKAPFLVRTPPPKQPPPKPVEQPRAPVTPQPLPSRNNNAVEKNNVPAVKSYAIFVANLPMNATVEGLEKVFKPYGPIKRDGIQVRSNKQKVICFGFVEFESAISVQNALEASAARLIKYGDRELRIEERGANNDRGRYSSGRGGYRNDNYRGRENYGGGRGNYSGGRGYRRNDLERGEYHEFSGQTRGNAEHTGESYERPSHQNGGKVTGQPAKEVA